MIRSVWRGKVALIETYWRWAVLGNLILVFPFVLVDTAVEQGMALPEVIGYFALAAYLVRVVYFPFTAVAVWRSAKNYSGRRLWPVLARGVTAGLSFIFLAQLLVALKEILTSEPSVALSFWW